MLDVVVMTGTRKYRRVGSEAVGVQGGKVQGERTVTAEQTGTAS